MALVVGAMLTVPGVASAAKVQLVSPNANSTLAMGSPAVFQVRDRSADARRFGVFITISTTKQRTRKGDLKKTKVGTFSKAERDGRNTFSYQAPQHVFPTWFMNMAGTYYWQAYHIDSTCLRRDCKVRSKVWRFGVQ